MLDAQGCLVTYTQSQPALISKRAQAKVQEGKSHRHLAFARFDPWTAGGGFSLFWSQCYILVFENVFLTKSSKCTAHVVPMLLELILDRSNYCSQFIIPPSTYGLCSAPIH